MDATQEGMQPKRGCNPKGDVFSVTDGKAVVPRQSGGTKQTSPPGSEPVAHPLEIVVCVCVFVFFQCGQLKS